MSSASDIYLSKTYLVDGADTDFLAHEVEVGFEVLLSSCVDHLEFHGAFGEPVAEEEFAAVHSIMTLVFQIEYAISVFFWREGLQEVIPILLSLSLLLQHLDRWASTISSFSILKTR